MQVREFNKMGIAAFREWLDECRQSPSKPLCSELLDDDAYTSVMDGGCVASDARFVTKLDAAKYLHEMLDGISEKSIESNAGLWSWLTLKYFDSVCPLIDGRRNVKNDYFYVYAAGNMRHFYRHLLFISWRVMQLAPNYHRLMLQTPVSVLDAVTDQVMKRLYITRIPSVFEVLDTLYWDPDRQAPRRGLTSVKPRRGDLRHRFPVRIQQLEKTFDLQAVSADQLIELLGEEFAGRVADAAE